MIVAIVAVIAIAAVAFLILAGGPAGEALPGDVTPDGAGTIGGADVNIDTNPL